VLDSEENPKMNPKEVTIEFREYQKRIGQQCILKNSLVVLPTGLGKTIIALHVAVHTLQKFSKNSKIIMLAPTRPLINQHYEVFLKNLSIPEENFELLTGKIPPQKRTERFHENRILFYTPQTLRNDLVNNKYTLEDVCLMIFDEAHHASGEFPYTMISDTYIEQNPDGTILALTASPGASKEKIKALCDALHIPKENIHTRTRKDKDVKTYLQPMDIYKLGVNMTSLMKEAYNVVSLLLEERLQYLSQFNFLDKQADYLLEKVIRKDLLKLNAELLSLLNQDGDKTGIYTALSVNAQALILFHMMELIEQQGINVLLIYLEKINTDARKKNSSKAVKIIASDHRLQHLYLELKQQEELSSENLVHPKYELLKSILLEEIEKNSRARILVFVKLRDSVKNIVNKLKSYPSILVARFVGQATKSASDKGLSQKKQLEILEKFKAGQINTLVSTNVGEEGLDIAECDLVIFYDVVVSETRFIQRRGRTARHRKGKVLILYCRGTNDEVYLRIALMKLKKMNVNLRSKDLSKNRDILVNAPLEDDLIPKRAKDEDSSIKSENSRISPKSNQATIQSFLKGKNSKPDSNIDNANLLVSKDMPMKFGLRSRLKADHIPFSTFSGKNHIILFKQIIIHIYQPFEFSEQKSSSTLQRIAILMKKFKLVLNIVDFIEFEENYHGEENLLKNKIKELTNVDQVKLIPIDNREELYFIVKNLYLYNKKEED